MDCGPISCFNDVGLILKVLFVALMAPGAANTEGFHGGFFRLKQSLASIRGGEFFKVVTGG